MSNRFYVNDEQIYGNNEMFTNTKKELARQGAEWTEDGTFSSIEIKDPQALMDVITKDSLEYLKEKMMSYYDPVKHKDVEKSFEELTDTDVLGSVFNPRCFLDLLYTKKGEVRHDVFRNIEYWISDKRAMTPYLLWTVIKNDVTFKDGKLILKDGHNIIACMY